MSAGTCERCGGDGVHPSKIDPEWSVVCFRCHGTGNFPLIRNPIRVWWRRLIRRIDRALDRLGAL